jgi:hypothetical protein
MAQVMRQEANADRLTDDRNIALGDRQYALTMRQANKRFLTALGAL